MPCQFKTPALIALLLCLLLTGCASPARHSGATRGTHVVQAGETLYRIARQHGLSVAQLASWNRISDPTQLRAGQRLRLSPPAGSATVRTPPAVERSPTPPPAQTQIALQWPLRGAILARYDGKRNKGIDVQASAGTPVVAAASGKVVYAGDGIAAYGWLVIVQHGGGWLSAYGNNRKLLVGEGARVQAGQAIAESGEKLHFELRRNGTPLDPLSQLPAP